MPGYTLSPRAQEDIDEIWDYTTQNWGEAQAERYLRQIEVALDLVADDPQLGGLCDYIRAGYRKYPAGSHVLFYRTTAAGINVVRILHQRMDFPAHL